MTRNRVLPTGIGNSLLRDPIEIKISLDDIDLLSKDLCPHCGGSGRLKAMQSMAVIGGSSIRGSDTTVKCNSCNGIGRK